MWILPVSREALLCFSVSLLFAATFCHGNDKITVQVVGSVECADSAENQIKTSQAVSGLRVTIDCKPKNGEFKTRGAGELDKEGKFTVSLPEDIVEDEKLKEECYAQLHSASDAPCPAHDGLQSSKIVFKTKNNGKHTFGLAGNLKFSPVTCVSAFLLPEYSHSKFKLPHLKSFGHHIVPLPPKVHPPKVFPPIHKKPLPPPIPHKPPPPTPPHVKPPPKAVPPPVPVKPLPPKPPHVKPPPKVLPPPVPVKPLPPKPPVIKPPPKVLPPKPPLIKPHPKVLPPKPPVIKPPPKVLPPKPPVIKPPPKVLPPKPPVIKPPPKVLPPKPPLIKPPPKVLPPKPPVIKPPSKVPPPQPPVIRPPSNVPPPQPPLTKPHPKVHPPKPPLIKKPFPPKVFHHPKFGKWPPLPPFSPHP